MTKYLALSLAIIQLSGTGCQNPPSDLDAENGSGASPRLPRSYTEFIVVDDYLYAVDESNIVTFNIVDGDDPIEVDRQDLQLPIEVLYHSSGTLIAASPTEVFTYAIERGLPRRRGKSDYPTLPGGVEPCDPIVSSGNTAYATINTSEFLGDDCDRTRTVRLLVAMDVTSPTSPRIIDTYDVAYPRGLSLDGDLLFVCNSGNGFTVYDVSQPTDLVELSRVSGVLALDVISDDGILTVTSCTELVRFDYTDPKNPVELDRLQYPRL